MNYEANIIKNCFKNKNCFLHCFERVKNSEIFTDNRTKLYWECFVNIYTEKEDICYSTVEDVLSFSNNDELIEDFRELVTTDYDDEDQWKYHLYFLEEQFKKKTLLRISKSINSNLGAYSADEVIHQINNQLRNLSSDDTPSLTFQSAFRNTLGVLQDLQEGNVRPMLETGNCLFDNVVGISKSKLIVVASQKKIGKSRWMVDLMDRTIEYNENVAILWFSLEMLSDEMIRCFISRRFKVTDNALLGKAG